jgi:hypothetical protein
MKGGRYGGFLILLGSAGTPALKPAVEGGSYNDLEQSRNVTLCDCSPD